MARRVEERYRKLLLIGLDAFDKGHLERMVNCAVFDSMAF